MQDFRKRRNMKREIPRMVVGCAGVLVLAVVAFMAVRAAWDMYGKFAAASQARIDAEVQLAQLQAQYVDVQSQVASLNTERGVEAAVRERYGVAKPGEGEIDIVRQAPTSTSATPGGGSWLTRLWHSLFVW